MGWEEMSIEKFQDDCHSGHWILEQNDFGNSFVFVLRFYGPANPMGSCRARSVYLTTLLLGRLSPLSG